MEEIALHAAGLHAKKVFSNMCLYNQIIRKRTAMNFIVSEMIITCKKNEIPNLFLELEKFFTFPRTKCSKAQGIHP